MAGRGCKKIVSDEDMAKAEAYALDNCQNGTICKLMGWHHNFLEDRPDILKKLEVKRAEHKAELRANQRRQAKTNPVMNIFLGKNALGQADKQEHKYGLNEETTSLLALIDGKSKGVLPSAERGGAEGETEMEV